MHYGTLGNTGRVLYILRLALSGAIAGAALATILSRAFGLAADTAGDVIGASIGFTAVVVLKIAHLS